MPKPSKKALSERSDTPPAAPMSERSDIARIGALIGVDTLGGNDELLSLGAQELNRGALCVARAGCYFAALKARLPEGEFVTTVEERGFDRRRVWEAMQIAAFLTTQPEERVRSFAQLPSTKALALARADQDVVAEIVGGGDASNISNLSVRELRQQIEKLQAKNAKLETSLETERATVARVKARALNRLQDAQLPEFCVVAREESAALTEQISLSLDALELLARDNLFMPHDEVAESERFAAMAAGSLFHLLRGLHARAGSLLEQLADTFPDVVEKVGFEHQLKPGELDSYKHARELILGRVKTAASNREAERHNAKGGRGRPRQVK